MKRLIQYIIVAILAIVTLALILINMLSSTILNKEYILSKLQEQNYYDKIYEEAESNFENYIHQSGLDEEVLAGIVSKDKIEKDTKIIIDNIYDGKNEKIDTEEIKNNLNEKIENSLNGKISSSEQKSIDEFVNKICEEYENTISHTNYEKKINSAMKRVKQYAGIMSKTLMIAIAILVFLLILLSLKEIYALVARIGTVLVVDGLIFVLVEKYITSKIKIETIVLLNKAISDVLQNILNEILNKISNYGSIMIITGTVLIVIYGIIKSKCSIKKEYTQED